MRFFGKYRQPREYYSVDCGDKKCLGHTAPLKIKKCLLREQTVHINFDINYILESVTVVVMSGILGCEGRCGQKIQRTVPFSQSALLTKF